MVLLLDYKRVQIGFCFGKWMDLRILSRPFFKVTLLEQKKKSLFWGYHEFKRVITNIVTHYH